MPDVIKELSDLKNALGKAQLTKAVAETKQKELLQQLKSDFSCDSLEEGFELSKKRQIELEALITNINTRITELKGKYEWS